MDFDLDIAICILPKIQPESPTVGPAVLKSHCEAAGFSAKVIDLNIDLYHSLGPDHHQNWYAKDDVFFKDDLWAEFYENHCQPIFERWAKELISLRTRWIGLSVFSNRSAHAAAALIALIKEYAPDQKIVVGGAGTYHRKHIWKTLGADHWITGDGEISLIELLKGNTGFQGIDNKIPHQVDDLDTILLPDYDDLDFSQYTTLNGQHYKSVYITGSRGCVRDCTFCDVASMWPKYRFRSGKHIAAEIVHLRQKHGIKVFEFTDSLVNGSLKAFRDMCSELTTYRLTSGDTAWGWSSQFICRSASQMPPEDWRLMKAAGCGVVSIGIESGSFAVRTHMRKGFTDADMWHTFEQCKANEIRISLMMMVGYPTETKEDFNETLQLMRDLRARGFNGHHSTGMPMITMISFGPTMEIYNGAPMMQMQHDLGITRDLEDNWTLGNNNIRVRIVRLLQAYALLQQLELGGDWWMAKRRNENLRAMFARLTGRDLPLDILAYDETLEYDYEPKEVAVA